MSGYNIYLQGNVIGFTKITKAMQQYNALGTTSQKEQQTFVGTIGVTNTKLGSYLTGLISAFVSWIHSFFSHNVLSCKLIYENNIYENKIKHILVYI